MKRVCCLSVAAQLALSVCGAGAGTVVGWGAAQTPLPSGLGNVRQLSSAVDHTLALRADGTVAAWGYNFNYQSDVPAGLSAVRAVAAGDFFSVVARSNGTVVAWGDNSLGQCELPPGLTAISAVSAGHAHVVALKTDGSVVAWGDNAYDQTNVPPGLGKVTAVKAAGNFSLALESSGRVVAWGDNASGQTSVPSNLAEVTAIDAAIGYCLARKSDGIVVAWGAAPQPPADLRQVVAIAAGEDHALALKSDGSIVAWGRNNGGQLIVPPGIARATAVAAAWHFSAAITGSGSPSLLAFNPSWDAGIFTVSLLSEPGFSYALEYKNALSDTSWTRLPAVNGTGGTLTLSDTGASVGRRSYRLVRSAL